MAKRADLWQRKGRNGKLLSWMYKGTYLKTKDATEARRRARLVREGKWPPPEERAAAVSVESFALPSEPVPTFSPGPLEPSKGVDSASTESAAAESEEHQPTGKVDSDSAGDWTNVAAAAAADASAEPIKPEVVNPEAEAEAREATNEELAKVIVGMQLWATEQLIKSKVWKGFVAPPTPDEARVALAAPYKTMLDYGGAKIKLPPWVNGIVIPAVTAVISAAAVSRMWAEMAREQKARAEASAPPEQAAA